ncbi:hypothetical protein TN889_31465 [Burkholderia gladioli pv. alliicola]|uniref:hypothetical protein n=1 Tax=Burkholderia gladioli TaxID=28095 RepID=UPI0019074A19|nr:hypothetical protein [Burkholderia gladioli]MBJ9711566.1 hypothetical protein [Burkholderia gladioli]MDZ4040915.1 hypothetical protein [Burkholderia gladioli pv. alliicola]
MTVYRYSNTGKLPSAHVTVHLLEEMESRCRRAFSEIANGDDARQVQNPFSVEVRCGERRESFGSVADMVSDVFPDSTDRVTLKATLVDAIGDTASITVSFSSARFLTDFVVNAPTPDLRRRIDALASELIGCIPRTRRLVEIASICRMPLGTAVLLAAALSWVARSNGASDSLQKIMSSVVLGLSALWILTTYFDKYSTFDTRSKDGMVLSAVRWIGLAVIAAVIGAIIDHAWSFAAWGGH